MNDIETLKAEVKRLRARATQAKMDLHDLSEELPTDWERILDVARRAYDAHAELAAARRSLEEAEAWDSLCRARRRGPSAGPLPQPARIPSGDRPVHSPDEGRT